MKTTFPATRRSHPFAATLWPRLGLIGAVLALLGNPTAWAAEEAEEKDAPISEATEEAKSDAKAEAKDDAEEKKEALSPEQLFEGGEKTYENWVEFSAGGILTRGNDAQAQENRRLRGSAFGGIEDLHYQGKAFTNVLFTLDGRALFDERDYKLTLGLRREEKWFVRVNIENTRTWYHGDGGFFGPGNAWYSTPGDALGVDRGEISFEAGLTLEKYPKLNFKYTHQSRDGQKGSTVWGLTHPDPVSTSRLLGLAPTISDLDEQRDIFELNATHRIKKTDFGVGLRYETAELDNARYTTQFPGEPAQQRITTREGTSYDLFSTHFFTETRLKKNLVLTTGFLFSDLDSDFSGSRIYGDDFDVGYAPNALNGLGYHSLAGGADQKEYVLNLNLMATPSKHWTFVPSIRVQKMDWDADSSGIGTLGLNSQPFLSTSDRDLLDVRERLDVRYTGLTNWVLTARGEWTQGEGNLEEWGGLSQIAGSGVAPIQRETEDSRRFQKYSLGARWYPTRRLSLDLGAYYKLNAYDYDHEFDDTPNGTGGNRYPAYLVMQDFETCDGNVRVTFRPRPNVTLVSRYEYQLSTIHTKADAAAGLGEIESSEMTSHIFAQNVSWSPWSRLFFQAGFNYVWSETQTPTSDYTQAILDAQNNYWTLNFNSGFAVDNKTDLNVGYFYYRADNFDDNSADGLPLGMSAEEHGVTATLTRRLTERLRLTFRYGYFHYDEETSGGNGNYASHLVYTTLQYRF